MWCHHGKATENDEPNFLMAKCFVLFPAKSSLSDWKKGSWLNKCHYFYQKYTLICWWLIWFWLWKKKHVCILWYYWWVKLDILLFKCQNIISSFRHSTNIVHFYFTCPLIIIFFWTLTCYCSSSGRRILMWQLFGGGWPCQDRSDTVCHILSRIPGGKWGNGQRCERSHRCCSCLKKR